MKILYVVRHAKSSWEDPGMLDHERPLNERGQKDASRMGKEMVKHQVVPQRILSSSALRARTTAEIFASELSYDLADIVVTDEIYGAEASELLEMIRGFDGELDKVMLVGHNPTVTDLANGLAQCNIHNVPTCGVLVIGFQVEQWLDVEDGKGNLFAFTYPKKLKE